MITPERIKNYLDKQHMACNISTLMSIYESCKEMSPVDAKAFIKEFYEEQLGKYGESSLKRRWAEQQEAIEEEITKEIEEENRKYKSFPSAVHICMPNKKRYGF